MDSRIHGKKKSVRDLAAEVWWLQPPFGSALSYKDDSTGRFQIYFESTQQDYTEEFDKQMGAVKSIWIARIVGKSTNGKVTLSLQFQVNNQRLMNIELRTLGTMMANLTNQKTLTAHILRSVFMTCQEGKSLASRLKRRESISQHMAVFMYMTATFGCPITVIQRVTG